MAGLHSVHFIKERRIKREIWDLDEEWMRAETGAVDKNKAEEGKVLWGHETRTASSSQSCPVCLQRESWEALRVKKVAIRQFGPVESQTTSRNNSRVLCYEALLMSLK